MVALLTVSERAMAKKKADGGGEILSALRDALHQGASRRSPLERWMWENYDEFAALMAEEVPNWADLTRFFEEHGLSKDGKPLGRNTARQTWWRVCQRKKDAQAKKAAKSKPEQVGLVADVVREMPREMAGSSGVAGHRPRAAPVRPTMPMVPVEDVSHRAASEPEPSGGDRDAVLRALNDQFNAGRGKMPDPIK